MICWALLRLQSPQMKMIAITAIILADLIIGPWLISLEWKYLKPYLMP